MSNFQQNPTDIHDFHNGQANHYGIQTPRMRDTLRPRGSSPSPPPPPPKDKKFSPAAAAAAAAGTRLGNQGSAYPSISVPRKPVGSANAPTAQAPIQRKPVGPHLALLGNASPAQTKQAARPAPASRNPSNNSQIRVISRNDEGRFDPSTIRSVSPSNYTPPQSPVDSSYARPGSRGSYKSFGRSQRTDTGNSSRPGSRSGSRRGSLSEMIKGAGRRMSDAFKDKANLVMMTPREREDYVVEKAARHEDKERRRSHERAEARKHIPETRKAYQQAALVSKNSYDPSMAQVSGNTEDDFRAMIEQRQSNERLNHAMRAAHAQACATADLEGRPRPVSPEDMPLANLSLTPEEDAAARRDFAQRPTYQGESKPYKLSKTALAVAAVSKAADPLKKRERSGTMESALSFGDVAPLGSIERCAQCNKEPENFLHSDGVCDSCHLWNRDQKTKMAKQAVTRPSVDVQRTTEDPKNVDPDSPPYVKIAGKHIIRKLRNTVYDNPGNPFSDDEDYDGENEEVNLFAMPFRTTPPVSWGPGRELPLPAGQLDTSTGSEHKLLSGRAFEDAVESPAPDSPRQFGVAATPIHAPTPQRRGTPGLVKERRQSMSVTVIPEDGVPDAGGGDYEPPRSKWRKSKVPRYQLPGFRRKQEEQRNTQFYGFYDDILPEYGEEQARDR